MKKNRFPPRNVTREEVERRIDRSEKLSGGVMDNLRKELPFEKWEEIHQKLLLVALFPITGTGRLEKKKAADCLNHLLYRPDSSPESLEDVSTLRRFHEKTLEGERDDLNIHAEHLRPRLLRAPEWCLRMTVRSTPGIERALAEQRRLLNQKRGEKT